MRHLGSGAVGRARLAPAVAVVLGLAAVARGQGADVDPGTWARKPPPVAPAHRFGVVLEAPRYNPLGPLGPNILFDGARDAHRLGFRTFKIAMSAQVTDPGWRFYRLTTAEIASVHDLVDLARLDVYRRTFALPFQTFVIMADAIGEGACWSSLATPGEAGKPRPVDVPLTAAQERAMYRQIHDLAYHLLTTYKGTGKVFILQDPETDWRVVPYTDERIDPSDVALENAFAYLWARQKAVDDARREAKAEGVYVYHCVEVNLVRKAMAGGKTVANTILPRLDCDLVGYSSYDTCATNDGSFVRAVNYLRTVARPSFAFGRNQVMITEIGAHERTHPDAPETLRSMLEAATLRVPWVVQWALYDNEAIRVVNGVRVPVYEAVESDLSGLWVRRPNGQFGQLFRAYRPYLVTDPGGPEPTETGAYVARAFRLTLSREPGPEEAAEWARAIDAAPWDKERVVRDLLTSPEYRFRALGSSAAFVFDLYRTLLGRDPDPEPAVVALLGGNYAGDPARLAYVAAALDSDEARRRYVDWLYRRYLRRPPAAAEVTSSLDLLARGATRRQVHDRIATGAGR
jgi:hypothetical protein